MGNTHQLTSDPEIKFQSAMADAGVICPDVPASDGTLHRFTAEGDKNGSNSGWYVLYGDSLPAGAFGNWKEALTDEFLKSAKAHKAELLEALETSRRREVIERWNPELASQGYVWCLDCTHWNGQTCVHTDNPFRKQQPLAPRKCQWYQEA